MQDPIQIRCPAPGDAAIVVAGIAVRDGPGTGPRA